MTYDNPERYVYAFTNHDFGTAGQARSVRGPKGKRGILKDIQVSALETFNSVTTSALVQVGTGADPDAYGELTIDDLADTEALNAADQPAAIIDPAIPVDQQVEITFVAPTGGTPAGMADVHVVIDWW